MKEDKGRKKEREREKGREGGREREGERERERERLIAAKLTDHPQTTFSSSNRFF